MVSVVNMSFDVFFWGGGGCVVEGGWGVVVGNHEKRQRKGNYVYINTHQ